MHKINSKLNPIYVGYFIFKITFYPFIICNITQNAAINIFNQCHLVNLLYHLNYQNFSPYYILIVYHFYSFYNVNYFLKYNYLPLFLTIFIFLILIFLNLLTFFNIYPKSSLSLLYLINQLFFGFLYFLTILLTFSKVLFFNQK